MTGCKATGFKNPAGGGNSDKDVLSNLKLGGQSVGEELSERRGEEENSKLTHKLKKNEM